MNEIEWDDDFKPTDEEWTQSLNELNALPEDLPCSFDAPCGECDEVEFNYEPRPTQALRGLMAEQRVTDPLTGGQKGAKAECYEQIPVWPLSEVARVYGFGAKKYARANFLKGYAWSLSTDALLRHIHQWRAGESQDAESGLSHLAHAAFHLFALMEFERKALGTDDRMYDEAGADWDDCPQDDWDD